MQDAIDLIEVEAGVLEHADEHEPSDRLGPIPALARHPGIRVHQAPTFVVPDRRGGEADLGADLADREQPFGHMTT